MSNEDHELPDDVLLEICRVSRDHTEFSDELLADLRAVSRLVGKGPSPQGTQLPHAVSLMIAAVAKLPQFNPKHLPFGYDGPTIQSHGWIERESLERLAKQIAGLRWADTEPAAVANEVANAVSEAVKLGFLDEKDYDAWQPGMASGSGWRSALSVTAYGVTKARSASNGNGSKQQKSPATNKPQVFYLICSSSKPPTLGQGTVFYKTTDGTVAQSLCRLFAKEYGGNGAQHHFAAAPGAEVSLDDQILLDEVLDELEIYEDPDRGVYDPPPTQETMDRVQFAHRATTWEAMIQSRPSALAPAENVRPGPRVSPEPTVSITPPFSDSEELNAVFADTNQCLQALRAIGGHYNYLTSLERAGKVRGLRGPVDGMQFASEDDRRACDDVEKQISAAVKVLWKPLARVLAWGRDQRLELPFDAGDLTSQIPCSWWDEGEDRGYYEYYACTCEHYQGALDQVSKAVTVVARKDSVAHIVIESFPPAPPDAIADVTMLTLRERQIVLDTLRKATPDFTVVFSVLYEAHLPPSDLILFQRQRDSLQAQFPGWRVSGCQSEDLATFKAMSNSEDIIQRVIAMREPNKDERQPPKTTTDDQTTLESAHSHVVSLHAHTKMPDRHAAQNATCDQGISMGIGTSPSLANEYLTGVARWANQIDSSQLRLALRDRLTKALAHVCLAMSLVDDLDAFEESRPETGSLMCEDTTTGVTVFSDDDLQSRYTGLEKDLVASVSKANATYQIVAASRDIPATAKDSTEYLLKWLFHMKLERTAHPASPRDEYWHDGAVTPPWGQFWVLEIRLLLRLRLIQVSEHLMHEREQLSKHEPASDPAKGAEAPGSSATHVDARNGDGLKDGPDHAETDSHSDTEIEQLETTTPPLNMGTGQWVTNKVAATLEGIKASSLADYRKTSKKGIKNQSGRLGRDCHGRIWRRPGTPHAHVWYWKQSLIGSNTT